MHTPPSLWPSNPPPGRGNHSSQGVAAWRHVPRRAAVATYLLYASAAVGAAARLGIGAALTRSWRRWQAVSGTTGDSSKLVGMCFCVVASEKQVLVEMVHLALIGVMSAASARLKSQNVFYSSPLCGASSFLSKLLWGGHLPFTSIDVSPEADTTRKKVHD
jgi:transposase-like protein